MKSQFLFLQIKTNYTIMVCVSLDQKDLDTKEQDRGPILFEILPPRSIVFPASNEG